MKDNQQKNVDNNKKISTRSKSSISKNKKEVKDTKKNIQQKSSTSKRKKIEVNNLETTKIGNDKTIKIDVINEKEFMSDNKDISNNDELQQNEVIIERKSGFNILEVIIIIIIALSIGGFVGGGLVRYYSNRDICGTKLPNKLHEFVDTYDEIINNYYEEVDSSKLLDAGIKGMIDYLGDKHSIYMDKEQSNTFNQELDGKLVGIGARMIKNLDDGTMIIVDSFEDYPAYKAGIRVGDILIKVDGEDVSNFTTEEIKAKVQGKAGTNVTLTIKRGDDLSEITITRELVEIPSVVSAAFNRNDKTVGYLGISIFAKNTFEQFNEKLKHLEENNIDSLIIDVRNNSGGHLDIVRDIASLFLDKSKIVYQLDTKGIVENVYSTSKEKRTYPIAVLINGGSASASEILAAALLESYDADVVGVSSYGKGTVQTSHKLNSGATIKYTHQKWLTPNGNFIDGKGITPTLVVSVNKEYLENKSDETDNQLQSAIDLLSQK